MKCSTKDCFECPYEDCKNDDTRKREYSSEQIKRASERRRRMREERIKSGICVNCGKRAVEDGRRMCGICREYFRRKKEEQNRRKGIKPRCLLDGIDLCAKCGKAAPEDGYKLCERCLGNCRKFLDRSPTHNGEKQRGWFTNERERFWASKKQRQGE